ncbi:hypothetical protein GIB67_020893, partial [Kingdonia uniflora]
MKFEVQYARMKEFEVQSARVKELEDELKLEKEKRAEKAKTAAKLLEKHSDLVKHDDVMSQSVEALEVERDHFVQSYYDFGLSLADVELDRVGRYREIIFPSEILEEVMDDAGVSPEKKLELPPVSSEPFRVAEKILDPPSEHVDLSYPVGQTFDPPFEEIERLRKANFKLERLMDSQSTHESNMMVNEGDGDSSSSPPTVGGKRGRSRGPTMLLNGEKKFVSANYLGQPNKGDQNRHDLVTTLGVQTRTHIPIIYADIKALSEQNSANRKKLEAHACVGRNNMAIIRLNITIDKDHKGRMTALGVGVCPIILKKTKHLLKKNKDLHNTDFELTDEVNMFQKDLKEVKDNLKLLM